MKVNFGPMRGKDITDMFQHYFEMSPPVIVPVEKLPEGKWTPAEVTQVIIYHNNFKIIMIVMI